MRRDRYLEWIKYKIIQNPIYDPYLYSDLIEQLHATPFLYDNILDQNRAHDGLSLRDIFANLKKCKPVNVSFKLADASVLEMMVALAIRSHADVMQGLPFEYTPDVIFWMMIENMGLQSMTNADFDSEYVSSVLVRMMSHSYEKNGRGGLFRIRSEDHDMRSAEIWYQMQWWAAEIFEDWKHGLTLLNPLTGAEVSA